MRSVTWRVGLLAAAGVATSLSVTLVSRGAPRLVECRGSQAVDFGCHARRYTQLVRWEGARVALRTLAAEQRRNGYVRAGCHQLTHRIGRAAGALHGLAALRTGSPVCVSGYYHGVLMDVMGRLGRRGAVAGADGICAELRSQDHSAEHYNCVHGMGHGYMEVFASDLRKSLDACRSLADPWEEEECAGGVFMENVAAVDNRARPSRYVRPQQPLYPCTEIEVRLWDQCYDWQITYALYVNDSDFARVFELCAARGAAALPCYRAIGGDALQQSKFVTSVAARNVGMRRMCLLGRSGAARKGCIHGVVRNMYRDYVDGDVQARSLCRSLAGSGLLSSACVRAEARARRTIALPEAI